MSELPSGKVKVMVVDLSGRVVTRRVFDVSNGKASLQFPRDGRSAGTRVITVSNGARRWSRTMAMPHSP